MRTGRHPGIISVAMVLVLAGCGPSSPPVSTQRPSEPAVSEPTTEPSAPPVVAPVLVRIPIPEPRSQAPFPEELAVTDGAIWIEQQTPTRLVRVDTTTDRITATSALDVSIALFADDTGALYAVGPWDYAPGPAAYTVWAVDPITGRLTALMSVPPESRIALGLGSVWVPRYPKLLRFNLQTRRLAATLPVVVGDVEVACARLWGAGIDDETLFEIDPRTGARTTVGGIGPVYGTANGCFRSVDGRLESVTTIIPSMSPQPVGLGPGPANGLQFDGRDFWVWPASYLQRYDPATGAISGPRWTLDPGDLKPDPKGSVDGRIVAAGGSVWLVNAYELVRFDIAS